MKQEEAKTSLVQTAEGFHSTEWYRIYDELIPQATTEAEREELRNIAKRKYHEEEYYAGVL